MIDVDSAQCYAKKAENFLSHFTLQSLQDSISNFNTRYCYL